MKIYLLESDGQNFGYFDYKSLSKVDVGISADYDSFRGVSIKDKWTPPKFIKSELIPKKKREKMVFGDLIDAKKSLLVSNRGMNCLIKMIKDYGEFLPTETEVGEYYFYNCLK